MHAKQAPRAIVLLTSTPEKVLNRHISRSCVDPRQNFGKTLIFPRENSRFVPANFHFLLHFFTPMHMGGWKKIIPGVTYSDVTHILRLTIYYVRKNAHPQHPCRKIHQNPSQAEMQTQHPLIKDARKSYFCNRKNIIFVYSAVLRYNCTTEKTPDNCLCIVCTLFGSVCSPTLASALVQCGRIS